MTLDHNRTARSQGRRGIATSNRECQREVRCTKHSHWANRTLHQTQVRAWQGRAIRQGFIVATIQIGPVENMAGKQAELPNRTAALALKAGFGQAGFLGADFGDFITACVDLISNLIEQCCAVFTSGIGKRPKRVFGGLGGLIDQCRGANRECIGRAMGRFGLERRIACDPVTRDQMFACQFIGHRCLLGAAGPPYFTRLF